MDNERLVSAPCGVLCGLDDGEVSVFWGVPYAAPPVGSLRFQPPQPHPGWSGARDARRPGPISPQVVGDVAELDLLKLIGTSWPAGDDFLTVNVWAPSRPGPPRPVMVFIHGGAFTTGSNNAPVQDGASFARLGVVCVSVNYRLGVEGFLPLEGGATNLGLRDVIAALGWVRDNAEACGGDPARITAFGESAGAMAIANLMASPLAQGLFRRAIVQSGHGGMVRSLPPARQLASEVARRLGVTPSAAGFAGVSLADSAAITASVQGPEFVADLREPDGREPAFGLSRFLPVHGDDVLPRPSLQALAAGVGAEVELLIGSNAEEMNLYFVPTGIAQNCTRAGALAILGAVHPQAQVVLEAYGLDAEGARPGEVLTRAMTDLVFRWPARCFAEAHRGRSHVYEFTWRSGAFGAQLGACHAVEMPFVFGTTALATGPRGLLGPEAPAELADRVQKVWTRFAAEGAADWPAYDAETRMVQDLVQGEAQPEPPPPCAAFSS